jgi:hypothetical protein
MGECPICYDKQHDTCVYPCMHSFCKSCISTWMNNNFTCPMCRDICELPIENKYLYGGDIRLFRVMKLIGVY